MVSYETRVYLTGLALTVVLLIVAGPILQIGLDEPLGVVVSFLFFPGLPFLAPQLYLAFTGDETENVPPRTRIRVSLLISGLLAVGMYAAAGPGEPGRPILTAIAVVLLGALFVHEMLRGYRSSSLFEDSNAE